jgi:4-hydroxythreonine-4-phosphate dehydrogenase
MGRAAESLLAERPDVELCFLGGGGAGGAVTGSLLGRFEATGSFDGSELSAGRVSVAALERGVAMALAGEVDALVTGPVSKPALHAAGARYPGQTEFLRKLAAVRDVGMLMAAESSRAGVPLRILLITTHLPLRDVPAALTEPRIVSQLELLHESLRSGWGISSPRIALCALNPHASDGGLFGDEEARVMAPAVAALRARGRGVDGPFPADTVFHRLLRGEADAVAVPYHDVGMAVFKTLAFGAGVNVTLGLPFARTSPDHGTAFDLAGSGRADPASALEALRLALRITEARPAEGASPAVGE